MALVNGLRRPALIYRAHCQRCRGLSLMIWLGSLAAVWRYPLEPKIADRLADQLQSKLMLLSDGRFLTGWRAVRYAVFLALPRWVVLVVLIGVIH